MLAFEFQFAMIESGVGEIEKRVAVRKNDARFSKGSAENAEKTALECARAAARRKSLAWPDAHDEQCIASSARDARPITHVSCPAIYIVEGRSSQEHYSCS
ncbi:hypothetical protein [Burkholderia ubonensis]|uniref:hypothetical protein n=1 Tax=Burkholderia ubonensis TaxID=101571 RepID=UPI00105447B0|nr:hypothetical protein [Burkholderia ubonensis]